MHYLGVGVKAPHQLHELNTSVKLRVWRQIGFRSADVPCATAANVHFLTYEEGGIEIKWIATIHRRESDGTWRQGQSIG